MKTKTQPRNSKTVLILIYVLFGLVAVFSFISKSILGL
jgi:hypothetical protein